MRSTIIPLKYHMVGQDALIIMSDGKDSRPVQVTHDALTDIQSPPQCDASRLAQYLEFFAEIAIEKIESEAIAFDGRIWITGDDVRAWRSLHSGMLESTTMPAPPVRQ
ncbi:hypothetical protein [Neorhizobium sp. DT-125]|uniref:hypothetical protein n=1 Tax=Neorhizobium sp. DT-125 TaxID=3396163 RepID=UPI003F1BA1A9